MGAIRLDLLGDRGRSVRAARPSVEIGTVLALGATSLLTDVSTEMVAAILPVWLAASLGFGALEFGTVDAAWRGAAGVIGFVVALVADRRRSHRRTAFLGYAVAALVKVALCVVPRAVGAVTPLLVLDRAGKGVRAPARDALITRASVPEARGRAFGLHRTLDTAGMLLGPIAAFALLRASPDAFDLVFVASACTAAVGLAVFLLFVREPERSAEPPTLPLRSALAQRDLVRLALFVGVFGAATVGLPFLLLATRRDGARAADVPYFYAVAASAQLVLSFPAGWLADRIGARRVFVAGHAFLALALLALARPIGALPEPWTSVLLFGAYLATSESLVPALASRAGRDEWRSAALALVGGASAAGRALGSIAFGALWSAFGLPTALASFVAALVVLVALASLSSVRARRDER